jgi:zinc/manganese transport system substrate-binding protein
MRTRVALVLVGIVLASSTGTAPAVAEVRVVAATTILGALADAVGGERVEVEVVARSDRDLHALEVRPSTMRKTSQANLYLEVGMSLDYWSEDIIRGSRNRNIRRVNCSEAVESVRDVPTGSVDASMGDVHPEGNPHYWLDPANLPRVARLLAEVFGEVDPNHAGVYAGRADAFEDRLDAHVAGWDARLRGVRFVEYHATWTYLAHRYGMEIVGTVEPLPGIPPSARHLADLSSVIREGTVGMVVREPYHAEDPVAFLVRETGVRSAVLPSSCEAPTEASLFAHLDRIVDVLGREGPRP